jgi:hypothetical protein
MHSCSQAECTVCLLLAGLAYVFAGIVGTRLCSPWTVVTCMRQSKMLAAQHCEQVGRAQIPALVIVERRSTLGLCSFG